MPDGLSHRYKRVLMFLGRPGLLFFALPWLMILLVLGTLAQKELGLYEASRLYFSGWILWAGPAPLPGAYLTIGAITVSLLVKFLFYSDWSLRKSGIVLTHLGVLVLLLGGMLTALTQKEGYIALAEDGTAAAVSDYHRRVLAVEKDGNPFAEYPLDTLSAGENPGAGALPFDIRIDNTCRNCRPAPVEDASGRHGLAASVTLGDAPPEKEDEANLSGLTFTVTGADAAQDGVYAVMEEIPHRPEITKGGHAYRLTLRRATRPLPFTMTLKDFRRDLYPGTDMPRGFASDVIVTDGGSSWARTISMNAPLRLKGYTLYQSSFTIRPDGEYSILSVVENKGRIFPYLASAIIFAGLLLHVMLRLKYTVKTS